MKKLGYIEGYKRKHHRQKRGFTFWKKSITARHFWGKKGGMLPKTWRRGKRL